MNAPTRDPRAPIALGTEAELFAEALGAAGTGRLRVTGTSMLPLLRPGDEVEVRAAEGESLTGGDIVVLLGRNPSGSAARLVVHRYLMTTPDGLLVRGDGTRSVDPFWPAEAVIGVVRARRREGRRTDLSRGVPRFGARLRARGWDIRVWLRGRRRDPGAGRSAGGSLG